MIKLSNFESSVIKEINIESKDSTHSDLFVVFKNDSTYKYTNIPDVVINGFINAESKGKHFEKEIKNKFYFEKVN